MRISFGSFVKRVCCNFGFRLPVLLRLLC